MITLYDKLKSYYNESLLDDEEELIASNDNGVVLQSTDFIEYYIPMGEWYTKNSKASEEMPTINKNKIIYKHSLIISEGHKPLSDYFSKINTIESDKISLVMGKIESPKTLCKNIKVADIHFHASEPSTTLKDINIDLTKSKYETVTIGISEKGEDGWYNSGYNYNNPPLIFDNVSIKTSSKCEVLDIQTYGFYFPKFINTKINCSSLRLSISNAHLMEQESIINNIDKHLDMNYSINVTNLKTNETKTKSKLNIKALGTMTRNLMHKSDKIIGKFIGGTKITDIFKDLPPNVDFITIYGSNLSIVFSKSKEPKSRLKVEEFVIPLSDGWFMEVSTPRPINAKYIGKNNWGGDLKK